MKNPTSNSLIGSFGTWLVDRVNVSFRLRRYFRMLAERWFIMAVSITLAVGGAVYLASHTPNIYSASSKIGIAPKIQTAFTSQAQYLEELNNFYDSQLQYMTCSKVMAKIGDKMRDTPPPSDRPLLLVTRAVKGPGSFSMHVECTDPDYARRYAQIWAREFITFKNELRENAIGKSAASTRDEVARYEKNLDKARAALLEFQRKNNLGSVKESGDAAQQRLDKLEAEYQDIKTLRQRLETKTPEEIASGGPVESPRTSPDKSPAPNSPRNTSAETTDPLARFDGGSKYSDLKLQIKARHSEWERQSVTLKPKHPFMVKLAGQIQQLNQELQHQLDLIEEKRLARIKSLKADEESYRPLIGDLRQQVLASRNVQYEYERLKEEETNVKAVLDNLRKAEESLNSTTSDEGLFNIIEEGGGSALPIRPNRRQMVLAGFIIGLGIGLGLIYLLGRLDDRMELAEDIEAELDEPVLGQLPLMDLKTIKEARPLVTNMDEHQMFYESMRGVRSAIILGNQGAKKQLLLMTSAAPGDGKTTFSVNFALTLAVAGHRVLLIDADMRRGDTHSYFENDREPGLAEVLQGKLHWSDVVKQGPVSTLKVIHTGKLPSNPGELLIGPVTNELIQEARQSFDYVLFDCPPLTAIDDAFALVGAADGILFIVRSGQTSMRFAKTAIAALRQRGAPLLGFVLNGIKPDNPYYYYKNYYHSYYTAETPRASDLNAVPAPAAKMAPPRRRSLVPTAVLETLPTKSEEPSRSIGRHESPATNESSPAGQGPMAA